jgi:hypothetical protein
MHQPVQKQGLEGAIASNGAGLKLLSEPTSEMSLSRGKIRRAVD